MAIKLVVAADGTKTYTFDTVDEAAAYELALNRPVVAQTKNAGESQIQPAGSSANRLQGPAREAFRLIVDAGDGGIINGELAKRLGIKISSLPGVITHLRRQITHYGEAFDDFVKSDRPYLNGARPR